MNRWRVAFGAGVAILAALVACVGDDPGPSATATPDAGNTGTDSAAPTTDASTTDGSTTLDAGPQSVIQVDLGIEHGCALISDGTVWCWGDNTYGQMGISPPGATALPAQQVPGLTGVTSLAVGGYASCAIKQDASLWCWGESEEWQLGHDPEAAGDALCGSVHCSPTPAQVPGIFALQASMNGNEACAVTTNHTVVCWGTNHDGQGGATASPNVLPTAVPTLKNMVAVKLAYYAASACGLDSVGAVWCWGKNTYGNLGHALGDDGDLTYSDGTYNYVPHHVVWSDGGTFDDVVDITAGSTSCAVRNEGSVWCWGKNTGNHLTLAQADSNPHPTPVKVKTIAGATNVVFGNAACALISDGGVYCWGTAAGGVAPGANYDGGCTSPSTSAAQFCRDPAQVPGPPMATLDVDHISAAGMTDSGIAVGWGDNLTTGRLGFPVTDAGDDAAADEVPMPIPGLPSP